jgi:hypothetical protein
MGLLGAIVAGMPLAIRVGTGRAGREDHSLLEADKIIFMSRANRGGRPEKDESRQPALHERGSARFSHRMQYAKTNYHVRLQFLKSSAAATH